MLIELTPAKHILVPIWAGSGNIHGAPPAYRYATLKFAALGPAEVDVTWHGGKGGTQKLTLAAGQTATLVVDGSVRSAELKRTLGDSPVTAVLNRW